MVRPSMTLRLRLVAALVVLGTAGLTFFGIATYSLYSHSQYQRLDDQIRSSVGPITAKLRQAAGVDFGLGGGPGGGPEHGGGGGGGLGPAGPSFGAYAVLRDSAGAVISTIPLPYSSAQPKLPEQVSVAPGSSRLFTVSSVDGSENWRVYATPSDRPAGSIVLIAAPLSNVTASLRRLVLIEVATAFGLLAILAAGSWLILRRGLRPLEQMATSARSITAGALSERVTPSDAHTEVGQLGLALNTMLSELEGAFQEREATEQRLRQFLADASHELRTPLTSIKGFAELFRLGAEQDRVDLEVIMRRIEDESVRMKTLVDDLLLLARLDETRPVYRAPVDLAVLAADACTDAVAAAPNRTVTLDAPEPVVVLGDSDHLRQAIANLVTNAIRHTPDGTPVAVAAVVTDRHAVVTVRDHGPGLDDEGLQHVFDRFWQADRARAGTGAGLGLSIVAGIAHEHRGEATVANAPGGGAIFTLRLPLSAS